MRREAREWLGVAAVAAVVLAGLAALTARQGQVASEYLLGAILTMALFALFALGLSLQFGQAGLINFGHVGFAAIGAYSVGIAYLHGWPWWAGVLAGLAAAVLFAVLLGLPTLRLREDYLAILTIGFAEILRAIANGEDWTGGALGIYGFPRPGLAWAGAPGSPLAGLAAALGVAPYRLLLVLSALAAVAAVYAVYARLARSPWGRVLKAIREDEDVAEALGKDTFRFKLEALALGALPAAGFGMLFAWAYAQIVPDNFPPLITFYAWIIVVLGGVGTLRGALAGSVALWGIFFAAQAARLPGVLGVLTTAGPGQLFLIGLLLVAVMMFRPQGLVGRREEMLFGR